MNAPEFLDRLKKRAKDYRTDAVSSINRNSHMNDLSGKCDLTQKEVDALLTDFINYCGIRMCVDYALYASDLKEDV